MSWHLLHRDVTDLTKDFGWDHVHIVTNGTKRYACKTQHDANELKQILERAERVTSAGRVG
jgi:hypothetical protein